MRFTLEHVGRSSADEVCRVRRLPARARGTLQATSVAGYQLASVVTFVVANVENTGIVRLQFAMTAALYSCAE